MSAHTSSAPATKQENKNNDTNTTSSANSGHEQHHGYTRLVTQSSHERRHIANNKEREKKPNRHKRAPVSAASDEGRRAQRQRLDHLKRHKPRQRQRGHVNKAPAREWQRDQWRATPFGLHMASGRRQSIAQRQINRTFARTYRPEAPG